MVRIEVDVDVVVVVLVLVVVARYGGQVELDVGLVHVRVHEQDGLARPEPRSRKAGSGRFCTVSPTWQVTSPR